MVGDFGIDDSVIHILLEIDHFGANLPQALRVLVISALWARLFGPTVTEITEKKFNISH
jgi:hypothetical protein